MAGFEKLTERASELLWGPWTVALVLLAGVWFSVTNGWIQLNFPAWIKATFGSMKRIGEDRRCGKGGGSTGNEADSTKRGKRCERENSEMKRGGGISPFQSAMTALAGTLGTGNIVGVATALTLGGAGAVFWMWIAALFGMMTAYAENILGILYRRRGEDGSWLGGPMLYMERGLGRKLPAKVWALFCAVAAFGVGNLAQVNSIAHSAEAAWSVPPWLTCAVVAAAAAPSILGGVQSAARLTEKLVPFMAAAYMLACGAVLFINFRGIPAAFGEIISGAFSPSAVGGGAVGAMLVGVRRGVFTNEAGLGSSVLVHASSEVDHPVTQGMWGIFEVFADTIVMCTATALVILTSGAMNVTSADGSPLDGAELSSAAFSQIFGRFSGSFITAALLLFAFATVIGWSCCGERAFGYLCGTRYSFVYKLAYVILIIPGGLARVRTVWALSDILNGLMAIPNTAAVLLLWKEVAAQTRDYMSMSKAMK